MTEATSTLSPAQEWLLRIINKDSGNEVHVSSNSMLSSAAIWYAINTIAGDIGKMPLDVRRSMNDGRGSEPYNAHPAWPLLRDQPNQLQTSDVFKETLQAHALGWGNGRAAIIREGSRPTELITLMPDRTVTLVFEGAKYHATWPCENDPIIQEELQSEVIDDPRVLYSKERPAVVLPDRDVLHIPGFGWNGYTGVSIAEVARDSFGSDLQAQRYSRTGMRKGFSGGLILHDKQSQFRDEDASRDFLEKFRARYAQGGDGEVIGMLRMGLEAQVLTMSNKNAQFIEQRQFNRQDIMLWFGLQHIPGDNSSVSYNSLEQKQLAYLASCLDRWLCRWELQCDVKLRTEQEKRQGRVYFKFNRGTWLRTDMETTQKVLSGYVQSEILSKNEARDMLDRNPVPGGDEFANPAINPSNVAAQAIAGKFLDLERKRIVAAAEKPKGFVDWIDDFYSSWTITLLQSLVKYGFDAAELCDRTDGHKSELLEAAGRSHTAAELKLNVEAVAKSWT